MSSRLAFQTQLASIMEVLANAAVAEICKLVDDDYAVVTLQMSQCQRENRALKRKLHLLELKMARGYAERRLALGGGGGGGRPRVSVNHAPAERFRVSAGGSAGTAFDGQMDMGLWPIDAPSGETNAEPTHPITGQDNSPDVQLVEPEVPAVKEERMEPDGELEDDVHLIGEDGVAEHVPRGARRPDTQPLPSRTTAALLPLLPPRPGGSSSSIGTRGVEVSGSSSSSSSPPPLKSELSAAVGGGDSSLQAPPPLEGPSDRLRFDARSNGGGESGAPLFGGGLFDGAAEASYRAGPSAFPSTSSDGWVVRTGLGVGGGYGFSPAKPPSGERVGGGAGGGLLGRAGAKERLFVCSYCGKAFNRPKKVEIHQRIHTGERPFRCSTCGKMFSEAGNLKKHQRVHTGEKPYYCRLCGKGFAWVRNLKTHQQKHHPDVYVEEEGGEGEQNWQQS